MKKYAYLLLLAATFLAQSVEKAPSKQKNIEEKAIQHEEKTQLEEKYVQEINALQNKFPGVARDEPVKELLLNKFLSQKAQEALSIYRDTSLSPAERTNQIHNRGLDEPFDNFLKTQSFITAYLQNLNDKFKKIDKEDNKEDNKPQPPKEFFQELKAIGNKFKTINKIEALLLNNTLTAKQKSARRIWRDPSLSNSQKKTLINKDQLQQSLEELKEKKDYIRLTLEALNTTSFANLDMEKKQPKQEKYPEISKKEALFTTDLKPKELAAQEIWSNPFLTETEKRDLIKTQGLNRALKNLFKKQPTISQKHPESQTIKEKKEK